MATRMRSTRRAEVIRAPRTIGKRRRRLPPEQRREEILQAVEDTVAQHGYQGATVPRINTAAGVAQGSFYRYFRDVDDAFLQLLRRVLEPLRAAAAELDLSRARNAGQLEAELFRFFLVVAEQLESRGELLREALLVAPTAQGPVGREMRSFLSGMRDRARGLLESRAGQFPFRQTLEPRVAAAAIVGMILGAAREAAERKETFEPRHWAEEMARLETGALVEPDGASKTRRKKRP